MHDERSGSETLGTTGTHPENGRTCVRTDHVVEQRNLVAAIPVSPSISPMKVAMETKKGAEKRGGDKKRNHVIQRGSVVNRRGSVTIRRGSGGGGAG